MRPYLRSWLIVHPHPHDPLLTELFVQGKPVVRRGRKARGLIVRDEIARLPALHHIDPQSDRGSGQGALEMKHHLAAGHRFSKRMVLAIAASALITAASPAIAESSACTGKGVHRYVPVGTCKHGFGAFKWHNCIESDGAAGESEGTAGEPESVLPS